MITKGRPKSTNIEDRRKTKNKRGKELYKLYDVEYLKLFNRGNKTKNGSKKLQAKPNKPK
jgi:hypothetical protein